MAEPAGQRNCSVCKGYGRLKREKGYRRWLEKCWMCGGSGRLPAEPEPVPSKPKRVRRGSRK